MALSPPYPTGIEPGSLLIFARADDLGVTRRVGEVQADGSTSWGEPDWISHEDIEALDAADDEGP